MPTNKNVLKDTDQFMSGYVPSYTPLYPLFANSKAQSYPAEVGKLNFQRLSAVADIRAKHITPKDTEIKQIGAKENSKTFKKYFLANQFTVSNFQDAGGVDDVTAEVLDEHQKHMDDLFLLGEGTSASTMNNNGLYWSADSNYVLESSTTIASSSADARLLDMHNKMMATNEKASQVAGQKVLIVYGATMIPYFNSLYSSANKSFRAALQEAMPGVSFVKMPEACTPSGANGWIEANLDQVKLHYTVFPQLMARGVNEEKMYAWNNFLMGSCMLEVLAYAGVVRQPCTF